MKDQHESLDEIRAWLKVYGRRESSLSGETLETWQRLENQHYWANNALPYDQATVWHEAHGFTMQRLREGGEAVKTKSQAKTVEKSVNYNVGVSGTVIKKSSKKSGNEALANIMGTLK